MNKILLATASFAALVAVGSAFQSASAADLPRKAPPLVAPADPWTGWFVGVNAGAAFQRNCTRFTPEGFVDPLNDVFLSSLISGCKDATGIIGGGQFGYNQRAGNWVWGFEADFDGLSDKTSKTITGTSVPIGRVISENITSSTDMLATLRAKMGILVDPSLLLYATGGFAMGHVNASGSGTQSVPAGPPVFGSFGSNTKWVPGWTAGAGAEWKMTSAWSLKAEYLYVDLGRVAFDETNQDPANVGTGFDNIISNASVKTQLHIVRAGVNYKFASGSDSAMAYAQAGPAAFSWTGLYAGGSVGGAWGHSRSREPNQEAVPGAGPWLAFGDTINTQASGVIAGAQAGYNWQMSSIVLGVEGDLGYMTFKGQKSSDLFVGTFESSSGGIYGMARGRLGFAWDRALFYATGGLMVADVNAYVSNPTIITLGDGTMVSGKTGTQAGWTAGGGLEYAVMGGWSLKGEYLHFDLGTKKVLATGINFLPPNLYAFDIKNTGDIVRVGFNKKIY